MWGLPPGNASARSKWRSHKQHDSCGAILAMRRRRVMSLTDRFRLPVRGGIAELDMQIVKLRMLLDSYQVQNLVQLDRVADVSKDRNA